MFSFFVYFGSVCFTVKRVMSDLRVVERNVLVDGGRSDNDVTLEYL